MTGRKTAATSDPARARRTVLWTAGALAILALASFVLRSCDDGAAPRRDPPAAIAPAPPPPPPRPAVRRAAAPEPVTEPTPDPPSAASEVLREIRDRPRPFIVVVTSGGTPVVRCDFAVDRPTGEPRRVSSVGMPAPGRFELDVEDDVDAPATIVVRAPGRDEVRVLVAERGVAADVALPAGGRVAGRVRLASGAVLGGARVHLAGCVATCDASGQFAFGDVETGRHTRIGVTWGASSRIVPCIADVPHPGAACDLDVVVPDAATVPVRVVRTSDGTPIQGVSVTSEATRLTGTVSDTAATDADGRCRVAVPDDGTTVLWAWGDAIELVSAPALTLPHDEEIVLRAEPYVLRRCAGRVVDPSGAPVAGMRVRLYPAHAADLHECITGRDGSFTFDGLRAHSWNTGPDRPSFVPATPVLAMSVSAPNSPADSLHVWGRIGDGLEIVWAPETTIEFVLKDAAGKPLPDIHATYRTSDGGARTRDVGSDGRAASRRVVWRARFASPGTLEVRASDGRTAQIAVTLHGSATRIGEIVLPRAGSVRLSVVPESDALTLDVTRLGADGEPASRHAAVHSGRHYVMTSVAEGTHTLHVSAPGRVGAEVADVPVRAGETTDVAVTLPRAATLVVIARNKDRTIASADVQVDVVSTVALGNGPASRTALHRTAKTSDLGTARFDGLAPGTARVTVATPDGVVRTVERPLADGTTLAIEVDVARPR